MAKTYLTTLARIVAWMLVILGVLFTILQAYLVGLPGLFIGGVLLWKTDGVVPRYNSLGRTSVLSSHASRENPESRYLMARTKFERHFASSTCLVPDDADPRYPLFRSFPDRIENDVLNNGDK